jgi:2-isopropylmalate synthase
VIVENREDSTVVTEALSTCTSTVSARLPPARANGPVNAPDTALRLAITCKYPGLAGIDPANYKVRILGETKGMGAITRVLLDASDGEQTWAASVSSFPESPLARHSNLREAPPPAPRGERR